MPRRLAVGLQVLGAWTALAVFFAVSSSLTYISQDRPPIWGLALAYALAQWWLWAALTPFVFVASRRWPLARGRVWQHLAVHLVLGLGVAYLKITLEGYARLWIFDAEPYLIISNLALQFLIYWVLVAVVHGLDHYGRSRAQAADAEARLNEAQLALLKAQLHPHFLFNALNAVSELIHEDPDRADRMVDRLSDLLRATLEAGNRPEVTLDEEIDLLRRYLAIQEVRFGDRLAASITMAPDVGGLRVPHLILQPLVENAISHGLGPKVAGGTLEVDGRRTGKDLTLTVADDGVGWPADVVEGIGLANTRARLSALYGDAGSLSVASRAGGGTAAIVMIPARSRPARTS